MCVGGGLASPPPARLRPGNAGAVLRLQRVGMLLLLLTLYGSPALLHNRTELATIPQVWLQALQSSLTEAKVRGRLGPAEGASELCWLGEGGRERG